MLAQAVGSFYKQTIASSCEIVIVNDGAALQSSDPRCRVVNVEPGMAIGAKRNVGWRTALGWAIATWDDDDISFENRLEDELQILHTETVAACRSDSMWITDSDLRIKGLGYGTCYPTALFRRDALVRIEGFPDSLSYCEDMEAFIRLTMRGMKIHKLRNPFYAHRRHTSNVSGNHGETTDAHIEKSDQEHPDIAAAQAKLDAIVGMP